MDRIKVKAEIVVGSPFGTETGAIVVPVSAKEEDWWKSGKINVQFPELKHGQISVVKGGEVGSAKDLIFIPDAENVPLSPVISMALLRLNEHGGYASVAIPEFQWRQEEDGRERVAMDLIQGLANFLTHPNCPVNAYVKVFFCVQDEDMKALLDKYLSIAIRDKPIYFQA